VIVVATGIAVVAIYLTAYVLYQVALFAANAMIPSPPETAPATWRRFNVIIPAHNEELHLPRLLDSFKAQDYPADRVRVTVVADNCTDGTVAAASAYDVDVLPRVDPVNRGKGYAIRWALERIDADRFDAVVIVDGDSLVARNFLHQLNLQMERGDRVIQCYNGVANPGQSWFTRLMDVSRTIGNEILHPAKSKLRLSSHLMGNGMCFDLTVLRAQSWDAFSVGEDWEYYAHLVSSGVFIGYSRDARVYHQESVSLSQASKQRMRWSSGRFQVLQKFGPRLLARGIRTGDFRCIDAALPLLFPNPSLGMNLTFLALAAAAVYAGWTGGTTLLWWCAVLALLQAAMFMIGVFHTREPMASALSLFMAPLFLVWKLVIDLLSVVGLGRKEWTRTERRPS
jgi:cellulose synthase/poly-beta-1,6-N-acetylglucosamine synthase-like glycosyltransferase